MKKYYLALLFSAFSCLVTLAQVRPFTPRYINPSVRGNIVYVSNNSITTNGVTTTEAPPSGSATNNGSFGVNLDIDNTPITLLPWNSTWKFSDSGYAPGAGTWVNPAYPDAGWVTATAGLPTDLLRDIGYGDGDEVIPFIYAGCGVRPAVQLPGCGTKYWTTYFRQQLNIPSIAAYSGFTINLHRDDGAVIYVNGTEVTRSNMPVGIIAYNTPASGAVDGASEDVTITIGTGSFVNGINTIAVEIHQFNQTSSDVSFRMELTGTPSNTTFNSTSSDLTLNSCSDVLWAGLYWGSTLGNSADISWRTTHTSILLKIPGAGTYATVTSGQTDLHDSSAANNHSGYQSFANVTSLLNTGNPNGTYTVANLCTPVSTGKSNQAAGWTLVIVYSDPTTIPRNLVVFDGFEIVSGGTQKDLPIAGFLTPVTGPVSCELGAVVYDGDRVSLDGFFFKQDSAAAGVYTDLSNTGTSGNGDTWNSTISYLGANVTTRNPAHANTLGYDADIIALPNPGNAVLGNSKTSARIRISSPASGGENFFLHLVTSSISVGNPSFNIVKSSTDLSGGLLQPGDSLRYTLIYQNRGTDTSANTILLDSLPYNVSYRAGSMLINGVAKTDISGDDQAEYDATGKRMVFRMGIGANSITGGQVYPNRRDTVSFIVVVTNVCSILACDNTVVNQARMDYTGKNSGQSLYDYSGAVVAFCFSSGPLVNTINGSCISRNDTTIVNQCPTLTAKLPSAAYPSYNFYSALPFVPANLFNPATIITVGGTYYAYITSASGSCRDTVRINVLIQPCPDIDDDDDGIPDYVESNGQDAFGDSDTDGIPNFTDPSFPGFTDSNGDGVNDNFDTDKDGIPNQYDLDSDNDGIPDVVESGGVDANGDGRIDNFTDTDNDGLSQNVDANNTGQPGSGNGLNIPDLDLDGIPNYIDLDSDNDGIPDVRESTGTDSNNDGIIDAYSDSDADGFSDNVDGDVGNDGTAENSANTLLRTGADINNDGRTDSYPFKNLDGDSRANPYDLDSDNDGISDVREAGFTDADNNGFSDGTKGADGWDDVIDALVILTLRNTDGVGNPNYIDIDADDDGIPDNVEGLSTTGYQFPLYLDTDNDGLDNRYDGTFGFGGNGITPNDQDGDMTPDYLDSDTDNDGLIDRVEGNDFNLNNIPDDNVTLTGLDTDVDGLDNRFDANNSSVKGTSAYMGTGGSNSGDPMPGSITMVQATIPGGERDWRVTTFVLDASFLTITASRNADFIRVNWIVSCDKIIDHFDIERSTDGIHFIKIGEKAGIGTICKTTPFYYLDNILAAVASDQYYYRIKAITTTSYTRNSQIVMVKVKQSSSIVLSPNPARSYVSINLVVPGQTIADIFLLDVNGKVVLKQKESLKDGYNSITLNGLEALADGVYTVRISVSGAMYFEKLVIKK